MLPGRTRPVSSSGILDLHHVPAQMPVWLSIMVAPNDVSTPERIACGQQELRHRRPRRVRVLVEAR
jgi:hypothetical protein